MHPEPGTIKGTQIMVCRMCKGSALTLFLDLGYTPPADEFRRKDQLREPFVYYPLQVYMCEACGLAQLGYVVSPEILYRHDYPYESSTTKMGREHWAEFARSVTRRFSLDSTDLVVDIGSNVGVLLSAFMENGIRTQGVDPAANIAMIAREKGIDTICDLFNAETVQRVLDAKGKASVITGTNVFAHIDNLDAFMDNVLALLKDDGVFIFEAPYFLNLVKKNEFDTIYHEHLSYLSVKPLLPFFAGFNMNVFDIEQKDIHGGSFRVFAAKKGLHPVSRAVDSLLQEENAFKLHAGETLRRFAGEVKENRNALTKLLYSLKHDGKRIAGVSAPAKGMTLLNYCGIGNNILEFVTEKSPLKIGRFTPGGCIPVVSDSEMTEQQPDYALLLAWNFAHEIMENLHGYRTAGGKFIIPIPMPQIVD